MSSLSVSSKHNGADAKDATDTSTKGSLDRQSGKSKSIKAMWKRFAFKATKTRQSGDSLPTSVCCLIFAIYV